MICTLLLQQHVVKFSEREVSLTRKTHRFVIWIYSKFTREKTDEIIQDISRSMANRDPCVRPKDDSEEKHPNYRNFFVDPEPALKLL